MPPVVELPEHINWSTRDPEWPGMSSGPVPNTKLWPWFKSKAYLTNSLSHSVSFEHLALESMSTDAIRECSWAFCLAVKGKGDFYPKPFKIRDILKFIEEPETRSQPVIFGFESTYPLKYVKFIKRHLLTLVEGGEDFITDPWPLPDQERSWGLSWDNYSSQQVLARTKAVFGGALRIYQTIVDRWFKAFGGRFELYACLPVRLEGRMEWPPRDGDRRQGPALTWYPQPLPTNESSSIAFELGDAKEIWESFRSNWRDEVPFMVGGMSRVFDLLPATTMATDWLSDDLRKLDWEN